MQTRTVAQTACLEPVCENRKPHHPACARRLRQPQPDIDDQPAQRRRARRWQRRRRRQPEREPAAHADPGVEREPEARRHRLARRLQRRRSRLRALRAAAVALRRRHASTSRSRPPRTPPRTLADLSPRPLRRHRRAQARRRHHHRRSAAGADNRSDHRHGRVPLAQDASRSPSAPTGRAGVYLARVELARRHRALRAVHRARSPRRRRARGAADQHRRGLQRRGAARASTSTRASASPPATATRSRSIARSTLGGQGGYFLYSAMPTVEYLEANGYDVTYAADHDVHVDSSLLPRARLVMVLAHDEYWSRDDARSLRSGARRRRLAGVPRRQHRLLAGALRARRRRHAQPPHGRLQGGGQPRSAGVERSTPTSPPPSAATSCNRPENALLGVMSGDWHFADFPWRVQRRRRTGSTPGLGVHNGDRIPGAGRPRDRLHAEQRRHAGGHRDRRAVADGERRLRDHQRPGAGDGLRADRRSSFVFAAASIRFAGDAVGPARAGQGAAHGAQPDRARRRHAGGARGHARRRRRLGRAPICRTRRRSLAVIAGSVGDCRAVDGAGGGARFAAPTGLALARRRHARGRRRRRAIACAASPRRPIARSRPSPARAPSGDADGAAGERQLPRAVGAGRRARRQRLGRRSRRRQRAPHRRRRQRHHRARAPDVARRPAASPSPPTAPSTSSTAQVGGLTVVHPGGGIEQSALAAGTFLTGAARRRQRSVHRRQRPLRARRAAPPTARSPPSPARPASPTAPSASARLLPARPARPPRRRLARRRRRQRHRAHRRPPPPARSARWPRPARAGPSARRRRRRHPPHRLRRRHRQLRHPRRLLLKRVAAHLDDSALKRGGRASGQPRRSRVRVTTGSREGATIPWRTLSDDHTHSTRAEGYHSAVREKHIKDTTDLSLTRRLGRETAVGPDRQQSPSPS